MKNIPRLENERKKEAVESKNYYLSFFSPLRNILSYDELMFTAAPELQDPCSGKYFGPIKRGPQSWT
jgi:hypothetical protein